MKQPTCGWCRGPLTPPQRKWCSDTCRAKFNYHRDVEASRARWRESYRSPAFEPVAEFMCAGCGIRCVPGENVGLRADKFCSAKCRKTLHRQENRERYRTLNAAWAKKHPKHPKQPPIATRLAWVVCCACDNAVVINPRVGRPLGGWRKDAKRWHCPSCPWWHDNQPNSWTMGRCRRCGDNWVHRDARGDAAYCSSRCANADVKDARRLLVPDLSRPRRYAVFERDEWRCQLCGDMTRKDQARLLGGKDYLPNAPTIDHIVPVSKGGTNDEANLQTAHWSCNSAKSDGTYSPAGEQLRLLAA